MSTRSGPRRATTRTPRYRLADIIPVTWGSDGHSYVIGDDGSVYGTVGTTVIARIIGVPPADNTVPKIDFRLLAHDPFSLWLSEVRNGEFMLFGGLHRSKSHFPCCHLRSWVPCYGRPSSWTCPHGCIYAIVSEGGYQDPKGPGGIDQFNATDLYLGRMAVGTPERHYAEVVDPHNWQWFAGFDPAGRPTWVVDTDPQLPQKIRSLSYPRGGHLGCTAGRVLCKFWDQPSGHAGFVNYPHMAYDRALRCYLLTFAYWYYRDYQPPTESGPMVQGGAELVVLESPHLWGPWRFVMRNPYLGSGNGHSPSFPVQWEGPRTASGQDFWMVWAANFAGCGKSLLVPADHCQGVYGMNLRRMHLTLAGAPGLIPRPWHDQDVGFASPGKANFGDGRFTITGNGNLALRNDPFGQYQDHLAHDAFHYVFQRLDGNGELTAQLMTWGPDANSPVGSKASTGLMLRESDLVIGQTSGGLRGRRLSVGDTFSETARYGYLGVFKDGSASSNGVTPGTSVVVPSCPAPAQPGAG